MKQLAHIGMVVLLSISIVAPSVLSICSDHYDIEITKDLGEDDTNKEAKKELESKDSFLEKFATPQLAEMEQIKCYNSIYTLRESSFTADIQLPPPKDFI